jgi:glycosyltransferase involved in cell wall biosynthesis
MARARVAVVVSGFPRLSETFALNELLALDERGLLAGLFAAKPGDGSASQPGWDRLTSRLERLPEGTAAEQGEWLAHHIPPRAATAIHGYFAHRPAEIAEHAARRLGLPFGFSIHAKDARKVDAATLAVRARRARCVVACNRDVAGAVMRSGVHAHLVPHGVDLERFRPRPFPPASPTRVLAVGRLVPKKGFDDLIESMAFVDVPAVLRIVGDGPLGERLAALIADRRLAERVELARARTHATLAAEYAASHVVVVPSVVDGDGDRDGLPNVVLEAMACGRPVVGTRVGAIPSAVRDRETGLLVASGSPAALADAVRTVATNPSLQRSMGERGREVVARDYELGKCVGCFTDVLEAAYA